MSAELKINGCFQRRDLGDYDYGFLAASGLFQNFRHKGKFESYKWDLFGVWVYLEGHNDAVLRCLAFGSTG